MTSICFCTPVVDSVGCKTRGAVRGFRYVDWMIVRIIGAFERFGGVPETMAAIQTPIGSTDLTESLRHLAKQVCFVDKPKLNNPGADCSGYDE